MPYSIALDKPRRLVVVTVTGVVDRDMAEPMTTAARAAATEHEFNLLYDFRQATPGEVDNTDVFWFPRKIAALRTPGAHRVRAVLLHTPPYRAFAQHWENTFNNVGLQVRAFEDEKAAIAWLTE